MNLSLFKSFHVVIAGGLAAGFWWWFARAGIEAGWTPGSDVSFVLWTGWTALALYVVLYLYSTRKHAHRLGLTPEFAMKAPVDRLERAHSRLSALRVRVAAGELAGRRRVRRLARRILREERVSAVLRVEVSRGPAGGPSHLLRVLPAEPIGRLATWMHAHIYYGLAAAAVVWFHGGGALESPMDVLLNGLSALVIATGFIGIALWTFGPAWLSRRERDLSIEQAFALREHYARKVEEARREIPEAAAGEENDGDVVAVRSLLDRLGRLERSRRFDREARAILESLPANLEPKREHVEDLLVLLAQRRNVEREWRALSRIRLSMNAWRLVHVPASIVLAVIVIMHVLSVWWY